MKKTFSTLLMFVIISSFVLLPQMAKANSDFLDISQNHWAYEDIQYLQGMEVAEALTGNYFKPSEPITRSKAARMLVKAISGDVNTTNVSQFSDVPNDHPDLAYINKSKELGIFDGYGDGNFGAEDTLSRGQMAKVLVNTFDLTGTYPKEFTDVRNDHWARDYIKTLAASEVTIGYGNGKFGAADQTTRAHMATFITRAIKGSVFQDRDLYLYASSDDFKVDQGVMYFKDSSGNWILPSEKHFSNATVMNAARSLLDEDRYLLLNYNDWNDSIPNAISYTFAGNPVAAKYGNKPFTIHLYTEQKHTKDRASDIVATLFLEYMWYDAQTDTFNPVFFGEKLQGSLEALFGTQKGKNMYQYIMEFHKEYQYNVPKTNEEKTFSKAFGSTKVTVFVANSAIYVDFSK
ncbi:hypothetical protein BKP35_16550 [Anaerobacillus arseniciselenatis]|uniref:SLH domain-containing protein n=1 Tax=Anaerobacillus arseniciselenatis TaxID=85682 RepID=A0A1S2LAX2_9BACI|nr:S-layer homology domain-containing protein [Anaerobacillus arseniciselenatis]OIJ09464.1 hypothetical protein BKP35_16550 [Anaerobacillus arseniciselenatis]